MKKIVILLAAISTIFSSILFFSCASNSGIPEDSAITESENTENQDENSGNVENAENQDEVENQTETADGSEKDENAENSKSDDSFDIDISELEPIDTITEPEIITLEPEEETEDTNSDTTVENTENEVVEPVVDSDLVQPEFNTETQNNSDESATDIDVTVGNKNTEDSESADFTDTGTSPENTESSDVTDENDENTDSSASAAENDENADSESSADENEESEEETESEEIIPLPSRTVTLNRGETLIVIYPGSGWIYLGSTSEYNNLTSKGRKLGSTDTTYTLLAKEAGTQLHHFYKTDNLTGNYIDDYLEVTVNETKGKSSTKITAPAYAEVIPPRPEQTRSEQTRSEQSQKIQESADGKTENAENLQNELETDANSSQYDENTAAQNKVQNTKTDTKISTTKDENQTKSDTNKTDAKQNNSNKSNEKTNVQQTKPSYSDDEIEFLEDVDEEEEYEEKSAPVENTDELLEQAKSLFNEKKYTEANTCLSVFFEYASTRRDEALYLQGQIYESESSVKDIKKAVETYKNLIQNYPASPYWDKANKRIIYLNRFYFEAR